MNVQTTNYTGTMKTHRAALLLAVAGIASMIVLAMFNRDSWNVDFSQYYAVGKLAGTGHVYDWQAIQALEREHGVKVIPFYRLPFYALVFKSLSVLPYSIARVLFLCIELAAVAGFVMLWPFKQRTWAAAAVCWSVPIAMGLAFGQDPVLFLFFATLGCWLLLDGRDFWAGVAFSICASKMHLAILVPLVLVAHARWKAILGGAIGGALIVALSFATEGPQWPTRIRELMQLPEFDPASNRMPNLRGLLSFFGGSFAVEIALGALVAVGIFLLSRRRPLKYGMTLALAGGLMLSHHAYVYDCPVLLPAILLAFEESYPGWLRMWALLLVTPIPYMVILTNVELPGHVAITGYTLALILTLWNRPPSWEASPLPGVASSSSFSS
jgi:hypothetical protein